MLNALQAALARACAEVFGPGVSVALISVDEQYEYDPFYYGRQMGRTLELRASIAIDGARHFQPPMLRDDFYSLPPREQFMAPGTPLESPKSTVPKLPSISANVMRARLRDQKRERKRRRLEAAKKLDAQDAKTAAQCLGNIGRGIGLALTSDHPALRFSLLELD